MKNAIISIFFLLKHDFVVTLSHFEALFGQ
jgi:hypothetical protein